MRRGGGAARRGEGAVRRGWSESKGRCPRIVDLMLDDGFVCTYVLYVYDDVVY